MSYLPYRTAVYRGAYAAVFVGGYLLLAAYMLSGDDSGSESNVGIWVMLTGLCLAALAGALVGPRLHRGLFKLPARRGLRHRQKHPSHEHPSHNQHSH